MATSATEGGADARNAGVAWNTSQCGYSESGLTAVDNNTNQKPILSRRPPPVITISGSTDTLVDSDVRGRNADIPNEARCVEPQAAGLTDGPRMRPDGRAAGHPEASASASGEPQVLKSGDSAFDYTSSRLNDRQNVALPDAKEKLSNCATVTTGSSSGSNAVRNGVADRGDRRKLDKGSLLSSHTLQVPVTTALVTAVTATATTANCVTADTSTSNANNTTAASAAGAPDPNESAQNGSLREQIFSFFQATDNKLALKLFGNQKAVMREKLRQQQTRSFVIHPCSNFRFYRDLVMLIMLVANVIILPVTIAFCSEGLFDAEWLIFNLISDTIFLLDIGINFRTGIILKDHADEIVLDPVVIAKNYVRTWFFLDLLSSVPIDYVFLIMTKFGDPDEILQVVQVGRGLRVLRLAKLLSLLKLLRLTRLVRYVTQWEEFLNSAGVFLRIFNLILLILLLAHWNACLQFLVPMLRDFPPDCWVVLEEVQEKSFVEQYTWAIFKTMSHMLCIGYGRSVPQSAADVWLTMLSMLAGAICYAMFIGHATALVQSFGTSKRLYREKFKQLEEYMCFKKMPLPMRQRIISYYEHRYRGKMFNEDDILNELSDNLREQIINYNCRALVAAVPFFTNADPEFVTEVVTRLQFEVFQPGDLIIREGTMGRSMYFLQEGVVDIISKEGEIITSLPEGSYFGEICLLSNTRRTASVRAITYCNVYSLEREHFLSVLDKYPVMRRTMESVAAQRLTTLGKNPNIVSSRADLQQDLQEMQDIVRAATPFDSQSSESASESSITWSGTDTDGSGLHLEVSHRRVSRLDQTASSKKRTLSAKRRRKRRFRSSSTKDDELKDNKDRDKDSSHGLITRTLMASFSNLLKVRSNANLVKMEADENSCKAPKLTDTRKRVFHDDDCSLRTHRRPLTTADRISFLALPMAVVGMRRQRSQSSSDVRQLANSSAAYKSTNASNSKSKK